MVEALNKSPEEVESPQTRFHILGASGLVMSDFATRYGDVVGLTPRSAEVDVTSYDQVARWVDRLNPNDVVVLSSAFTDVKAAELQKGDIKGLAYELNVNSPLNVARACLNCGPHLVMVGTGFTHLDKIKEDGPFDEDRIPVLDPESQSWYAYTKGVGIEIVRRLYTGIPGLSLVLFDYPFGPDSHYKLDLAATTLTKFDKGILPLMFGDQTFTPGYKPQISEVVYKAGQLRKSGTFHSASRDQVSFYEWSSYLVQKTRGIKNAVRFGSLVEYRKKDPNANAWPMKGGLKTEKTARELAITFMTWREQIDDYASRITA